MVLIDTLRFILGHPLNKHNKLESLLRFARWQFGSRLFPGDVAIPFVNNFRLLVRPGMTGATGNLYCGLHEFEDMAFVLHFLRDTDVFVDIGANIGSYTVLASGAVGANTIAIEPIPSTYQHLIDNVNINNIGDKVSPLNIGLGSHVGTLNFSSDQDTVNHVIAKNEKTGSMIEVAVDTLDHIVTNSPPTLIKIDVEGFETEVFAGAADTLSNSTLRGIIVELNGSGARYGFDEDALHDLIIRHDFSPVCYQPFERKLTQAERRNSLGNTLYVRDFGAAAQRLETSQPYNVGKHSI
ncbi:MAG: FkbM family methyltransferase [Gammaproteobacteria bacterium]|nr:FkbM family methyltransferase [Gammaproteobacteria bacterium]